MSTYIHVSTYTIDIQIFRGKHFHTSGVQTCDVGKIPHTVQRVFTMDILQRVAETRGVEEEGYISL